MEKEFVPYEQALELKKLLFNERCFGYYNNKKKLTFNTNNNPVGKDWVWFNNEILPIDMVLAPTFSQSFRFFRDRFLNGEVFSQQRPKGNFMYGFRMSGTDIIHDGFKTYEEAEVECLKVLIQISKTK